MFTRLFTLMILVTFTGCGPDPLPTNKGGGNSDPQIHFKESVGGGVGPANANRTREYEGPESKAPNWAKTQAQPKAAGK